MNTSEMRSLRAILLTGGAGFIGSALTRELLNRTEVEHIVILDKLTYAGNLDNLVGPDKDPRFQFIEGDINDQNLVAQILADARCTGIMNLAAESHVDRSIGNPADFVTTNIVGTSHLLEIARAHEVPLLQCSTDEVYGPTPPPEQFNESAKLKPSSPYSASKASSDLLAQAAHVTYGQDIVITRCSNNYGPRQHREKLIPNLVYHAIHDLPLPIYGSGQQVRDWIHVEDCVKGIVATFEKGLPNHVYHLGAKCEQTNLEIAQLILKQLDKPQSLIAHIGDRPGHDLRYALDPQLALAELGWAAKIPFHTGFERVVREFSKSLR